MRLARPEMGESELSAVEAVMSSGNLTQGSVSAEFERLVGDYVGTQYAVATSSCTTALHLALTAIGIADGDEVIVPDFTFPATANAVIQAGAKPILVDVDVNAYTLDPQRVSYALSDRTRAIIPVHTFGVCADIGAIQEAAPSIPIIEDAACALGSSYYGQRAGSLGTIAAFSFHPRKVITTGEGGMLTLHDPELANRLRLLASHGGRKTGQYFEFIDSGFNFRLSDISAAIGVSQMSRLDRIVARRRSLANSYSELLQSIDGVTPQMVPAHTETTFQSYVVRLSQGIDRDWVINEMKQRGIETTLGTYSLNQQPYFRDTYKLSPDTFPNSTLLYRQTLTLPLHTAMSDDDVAQVCRHLSDVLA